MKHFYVFFLALPLLLVLQAGCQESNGRLAVAGSVQFQGKPLDQGTLAFHAVELANSPPALESAAECLIADGRFSLPAEQGLLPGMYLVRIRSTEAFDITPEEYAAGKTAPPPRERISEKYNTASTLTVTVGTSGNSFSFTVD